MLYSFTFRCECAADLEKLQQLLADLVVVKGMRPIVTPVDPTPRIDTPHPDKMVQPDRTPAEEPKPKGRPRKLAAVPETEPAAAPANGNDEQLSDQGMLSTVGAFCSAHPDKTNAISALLRTFGAERITQLEVGQRQPFLLKLESLKDGASGPEAA